jgi:squalene cyclase
MALCEGGLGTSEAARRAVRYLVNAQRQDGNWPRQTMVGVFNRTTLIHYDNYRRYFPIWALSLQLAAEQR